MNLYHTSVEARERSLAQLSGLPLQLAIAETTSVESTALGVTKAKGLEALCAHVGCSLDECIAVGDANNDLEVMRAAGLAIAIVREDLITDEVLPGTPTMLRYKTYSESGSLFNTPPTYGIYMCGKVFKWLKAQGGLSAMKVKNEEKAAILYNFLDQSQMFKGTVVRKDRSIMNVPFVTGDKDLDAKFIAEAKAAGFVNLKGHRTVGGMRASLYNAMPKAGVEDLVEFMAEFEKKNR